MEFLVQISNFFDNNDNEQNSKNKTKKSQKYLKILNLPIKITIYQNNEIDIQKKNDVNDDTI